MNIFCISGSPRKDSYNTALLHAAATASPGDMRFSIFSGLCELPIFSPDQEVPDSVESLSSSIRGADGLFISTPEYAHSIPGGLKNLLDWLVASDAMVLKPVLVASVSTSALGGARGYGALVKVLSAMNATVVVDGSLNVPFARNRFSRSLELTDPITARALENALAALARAIEDRQVF